MFFGLIKIKKIVDCKNCNGIWVEVPSYPYSGGYRILPCNCCGGKGKIEKLI